MRHLMETEIMRLGSIEQEAQKAAEASKPSKGEDSEDGSADDCLEATPGGTTRQAPVVRSGGPRVPG